MERNPLSDAGSHSTGREIPHRVLDLIWSQLNTLHTLLRISLANVLILSHLRLCFPSCLFPSSFLA